MSTKTKQLNYALNNRRQEPARIVRRRQNLSRCSLAGADRRTRLDLALEPWANRAVSFTQNIQNDRLIKVFINSITI